MIRYSVQPRDRIFVKCYGFLSFPKNMDKSIGKNISKKLSGKYSQKIFLILLTNLLEMNLTLLQKESFKKQQKQLVIWLVTKSLTELPKFQKINNKITQKQL